MTLAIDLGGGRALVTGASSGIGQQIALTLAQAGCDIAGCGLEPEADPAVQQMLAGVAAHGRRGHYRQADLADAVQARGVAAWAAAQLGGLDYVVSNAGRNVFRGVDGCDDAAWDANMDLNLAAHWRVIQSAKRHLDAAAAPVVVVIASNHAFSTIANSFPYNVAKAGLTALVTSLAIEWGPHVRAVGVAPGFIETPLAKDWFDSFPDPAAKRAAVAGLHPVARLGQPAEIAALCAFLCSPLAGFITGTTLLADGGRRALMQDPETGYV